MQRTRRAVLGGALTAGAAVLSGCSAGSDDGGDGDDGTDGAGESVVSGLSLEATAVSDGTDGTPPRFDLALANEGSAAVTLEYGGNVVLYGVGAVEDAGVRVVPVTMAEERHSVERDGCWHLSSEPDSVERVTITVLSILRRETLAPGERVETPLYVYAGRDGCSAPVTTRYRVDLGSPALDDGRIQIGGTVTLEADRSLSVTADAPTVVRRD